MVANDHTVEHDMGTHSHTKEILYGQQFFCLVGLLVSNVIIGGRERGLDALIVPDNISDLARYVVKLSY